MSLYIKQGSKQLQKKINVCYHPTHYQLNQIVFWILFKINKIIKTVKLFTLEKTTAFLESKQNEPIF